MQDGEKEDIVDENSWSIQILQNQKPQIRYNLFISLFWPLKPYDSYWLLPSP